MQSLGFLHYIASISFSSCLKVYFIDFVLLVRLVVTKSPQSSRKIAIILAQLELGQS